MITYHKMINWQSVIFNSFWITGLSVLLAAFSYHTWAATEYGRSLRVQLAEPAFLRFFWLAACLIGVGLAGTSSQLWEMLIWGGMALVALVFFVASFRET